MGLFDKLKKSVTDAKNQFIPPQQQSAAQPVSQPPPPDAEDTATDEETFDVAGFDVLRDEAAFFRAVLHMESEGMFGGTDESRAEICAHFGIRDHGHWLVVKESNYALLARKYGSYEEVGQQELNWRQGQMQQHMVGQQQAMAAKGGFDAVEGITLEAWAAINAAIVGGANPDDLLVGQRIDKGRWERASAEWNARMARDTTFAIATVYGNAFQAASKGKYGDYAREATAARAANRELQLEPPMSWEQYWELLYEQKYGALQGKDPVEVLRSCQLTIVDWTDLSTFMGYHFHRTAQRHWSEYEAIHKRVEAKLAAKYPGVQADVELTAP